MARVYVSVGSNVDRARNIRSCLQTLRNQFGALTISTIYESAAVGFDGDPFYNLAVGFDTDQDIHAVARALREIEYRHGRERGAVRFAPRTLDLDLLLYGDLVLHQDHLQIPRDEITRYAFVLRPLAEIAGERIHPLEGKTFARLWIEFQAEDQPLWPVQLDV